MTATDVPSLAYPVFSKTGVSHISFGQEVALGSGAAAALLSLDLWRHDGVMDDVRSVDGIDRGHPAMSQHVSLLQRHAVILSLPVVNAEGEIFVERISFLDGAASCIRRGGHSNFAKLWTGYLSTRPIWTSLVLR